MIIFKNSSVEQAFTMPVSILYQGMLNVYFDYDYWSVVFTQEKLYAADKIQMWNSHCGVCLVCEACQEMVSWCRKVSVGICSKPWALPGVRLQISFWEKDMGWKLLWSWGGSRHDIEWLLLCTNLQGVYALRKLFATSQRYKNTCMNYTVYQIPLRQNRNVGFVIIERIK